MKLWTTARALAVAAVASAALGGCGDDEGENAQTTQRGSVAPNEPPRLNAADRVIDCLRDSGIEARLDQKVNAFRGISALVRAGRAELQEPIGSMRIYLFDSASERRANGRRVAEPDLTRDDRLFSGGRAVVVFPVAASSSAREQVLACAFGR